VVARDDGDITQLLKKLSTSLLHSTKNHSVYEDSQPRSYHLNPHAKESWAQVFVPLMEREVVPAFMSLAGT